MSTGNDVDAHPFAAKLSPRLPPPVTPKEKKPVVINEVKTDKKFEERERYLIDETFEYARNGSEPGVVLIFNQETFEDPLQNRSGSRRDVNELILCLQRQGYNIYKDFVCFDYDKDQILKKLDEVANDEALLERSNCLMVFFMSHGDSMEFIYTSNKMVRTYEIWKRFALCDQLRNKPKMFVFQACKGHNFSTPAGETKMHHDNTPSNVANMNTFAAQLQPDMLVVYSTLEGNLSFRHSLTGSWFIQELCKNIYAYGRRDDVVSILVRTTKCVTGNYYNLHHSGDVQKQMPLFVSTLKRKFFLNRNKDRGTLLKIQKDTEEILAVLRQLKETQDNQNQRK